MMVVAFWFCVWYLHVVVVFVFALFGLSHFVLLCLLLLCDVVFGVIVVVGGYLVYPLFCVAFCFVL